MFELLHSHLQKIEESYQKGIEVTNQLFSALKTKQIKSLPELSSSQTVFMKDIKILREEMADVVREIAQKNGIQEFRIQSIIELFEFDEKEKILDITKRIVILENEIQCSLRRNEMYLEVMMDLSESVINSAILINENENEEMQLFLDQKF